MRNWKAPVNTEGRDFVVGDIHGEFSKLDSLLQAAGFDKTRDRVFAVGDLVDRGPENYAALDYLAQPWFHSVLGNHEELLLGHAIGQESMARCHIGNGGEWFLELDPDARQHFARRIANSCWLSIEIPQPDGSTYGVVHAEVPEGRTWDDVRYAQVGGPSNSNLVDNLLWGRSRVRSASPSVVDGIDKIFVGHTPVKEPVRKGNHIFVDTGACFGRQMTLMDMRTEEVWQV